MPADPSLSRADLLSVYSDSVNRSLTYRQQFDQNWQCLTALAANDWDGAGLRPSQFGDECEESFIRANRSVPIVNLITAVLTEAKPGIEVEPARSLDYNSAQMTERIANYFWDRYAFKTPVRLAIRDAVIMGHGWLKTTWQFDEDKIRLTDKQFEAAVTGVDAAARKIIADRPQMGGLLPFKSDIKRDMITSGTVITADKPMVTRISPMDILVDPHARSMDTIRWIAQRIERPEDVVSRDKSLKKSAREKANNYVSPALSGNRTGLSEDSVNMMEDNTRPRVEYWEFYDLDAGTFCAFQPGAEEFLVAPKAMPYVFGHPFVMIPGTPIPDRFYPMGDIEPIQDLIVEQAVTASELVRARREQRRIWLIATGSMSPEDIKKIVEAEDGDIVAVDGTDDLKESIVQLPTFEVKPESYRQNAFLSELMDETVGLADFMLGGAATSSSATTAAISDRNVQARIGAKREAIECAIQTVIRNTLKLARQYMTTADVMKITGVPDSTGRQVSSTYPDITDFNASKQELYFQFSGDQIAREFDVRITPGSMSPESRQQKLQNALSLSAAILPLAGIEGISGRLDVPKIVEHILTEAGVADPGRFFRGAVHPAEEPQAQATIPGGVPQGQTPEGLQGLNPQQAPTIAQ